VYWYDKREDSLRRLWLPDRRDAVRCLALVDTVDLMLAAGTASGAVVFFQIPQPECAAAAAVAVDALDADDQYEAPAGSKAFLVKGAHSFPLTALAWSKNGMRLFSGDQNGNVSMTEVDFATASTATKSIFSEDDQESVVQLRYSKKRLLISTR